MSTKKNNELTLRDRLSRLKYEEVKKLLGEKADYLLKFGGKFDIEIESQVTLDDDMFKLSMEGGEVTIECRDDARRRLHMECSGCYGTCEHIGAAFSLILEEKMALGLSIPRPETVPLGALDDDQILERGLRDRELRAKEESMRVHSQDPEEVWTDYEVRNLTSGRSYRVAFRGFENGESYCSCPDFRRNTLGTCKHIMRVAKVVKRRFPKKTTEVPYERKTFGVHLAYGERAELRLLTPAVMGEEEAKVASPIADREITDIPNLLKRIGKLEALGHDVTIYPDAEEFIEACLFKRKMAKICGEIRENPSGHPLGKSLLRTELLPYQLDGIAFAALAGRAILADDMGLGKTVQGVGVAEFLARYGVVQKVLVICPTSIKSQWRSEIKKFSQKSCQLILGKAEERALQYDNEKFFTICNYEQVLRDIEFIEEISFDLIILDEGQRIKNWETQTSRIVKGLSSRFALVLTGTPLENRLDDLYSIVEFVDDRRLGPPFRFFNRHRIVDDNGKVLGFRHLDEIRDKLGPVMLRRTRASVLDDLPPRTTEIIRVTPTEEQRDIHGGNMRILSQILGKKYLTEMDLLRLRKLLLMCRLVANSTFLVTKQPPGYSSKLEALDNLLYELAGEHDRKIVLFSEWTTMLGLIEPLLEKNGLSYVRLDGSVPQKKRQGIVDAFQNDPSCRVFITTNAGATGLNLQAANTVINVDLPWNPAVLEQRIARAHRMGQTSPVQVFLLVTDETIEDNILGTLSAKNELSLAALDFDSPVEEVELQSGAEELRRRLEKLLGATPEAPVDESQQNRTALQITSIERKKKVSEAGGQLLRAAFGLLDELVPESQNVEASKMMTEKIHTSLSECLDVDEEGRPVLMLTFADVGQIQSLASTLARLLPTG